MTASKQINFKSAEGPCKSLHVIADGGYRWIRDDANDFAANADLLPTLSYLRFQSLTIGCVSLRHRIRNFPWPLAITSLRLLLVPVFLYLLILAPLPGQDHHLRYLALGLFAVMAITDLLDGYLARKLKQVSRLGTFLDPTADKILISGSLILLTFPRFAPAGFNIPWPILWGVYQKDLCVVIGALVVKHKIGKVEINANFPGKINTVVEIVLVLSTLFAPEWVAISPAFAAIVLWSLWHLTVLATAASAFGYSIEGARQLRQHAKQLETPDLPKIPFSPA